jgi:hypothetical protein
LALRIVRLNSHVENFIKKPIEELGIINEPNVLISQLRRQQEKSRVQPDPEPTKQC